MQGSQSLLVLSLKNEILLKKAWQSNLGTDNLAVKPYIPQKNLSNEFVANVLRDNMVMVIFDLRGCGGCQRPKTSYLSPHFGTLTQHLVHPSVVYDRNHYFSFGPIPKPKPKLVDTFGRYRNRYRNHISKGKSSYQQYGIFFQS